MSAERPHLSEAVPSVHARRGGFALALVLILLFAIGVIGTVGFQVVQVESNLSNQAREMNLALSVAEAGLKRFLGEHRGHPPGTTIYGINGGQAVVVARKLSEVLDEEDLYLVSSTGTYADPLYSDAPATRTVHQHAILKILPIGRLAALTDADTARLRIERNGIVDGRDAASLGACTGSGLTDLAGVVTAGWTELRGGSALYGNPPADTLASRQAVIDSLRARWDILTDPTYAVDLESTGSWTTYMSGLPSDSFPVVRVNGGLAAGASEAGRGVLIVTDSISLVDGFAWNGIILAGRLGRAEGNDPRFTVLGLMASGFSSLRHEDVFREGLLQYHSCYALAAGRALAHFEPVENTWWEEY